MSEFRVAIIGAGLGGLVLAQGLNRAGIAFDVYERDPAPDSRIQGYRIRIDADGQHALAAVLPSDLYALFRQTASTAATEGRFITPQMEEATGRVPESWRTGSSGHGPNESPDLSVNRQTLREILMCGIKENIHFGHDFENFRILEDGRVELVFDAADPVVSSLAVGADGVNSRVRTQLVPHATPSDTGAVCIYGKSALNRLGETTDAYAGTSVVFADGYSAIIDEMRFEDDLSAIARSIAPGCKLTDVDDYRYWAVIGSRDRLGLAMTDAPAAGSALGDILSSLTKDWHPALQQIMDRTDLSAVAMLPVRSGRPEVEWRSGPVTLLGDAVHAMSPAGGVGANTALRDALALADALSNAEMPQHNLVQIVAGYERVMRDWASKAVTISNRGAAKLFGVSGTAPEIS
ncbi:NAD(P)/FAD-dependent oxidoreductase [uncultured Thalassospira sp.]|uniref:FAD-dependent oxidoreductase n=1 Tax=uncultured Thalassospira sp. TaxID=404382 RepID=UPI0030DA5BD7|tara:strand:+ start:1574 stop:2791 length:1218 start_codon:yes stop_codon:yes gene_type:complete